VEEHLARGDSVCIGAKDAARLEAEIGALAEAHGEDRVFGAPCDIGRHADVQALAALARERLGRIDAWVCNAASNGGVYEALADTDPAVLEQVAMTNCLGVMLCAKEAANVMRAQEGGGDIFLMTGAGSTGEPTRLYAAYGFTKAGIPQLAKSLRQEMNALGVNVHTMSPGLVFTDLLRPGEGKFGGVGNFLVNVIGEYPEAVAAKLVPEIRTTMDRDAQGPLASLTRNKNLTFFTPDMALTKLYRRLAFGERKGEFFSE